MNREELIGLRKQIQKVIEDGRAFPADVLSAQIVLVFEQAHAPTEDEREALRKAADRMSPLSTKPYTSLDLALVREAAYRVADGTFRRTVQGEPSAPDGWLPFGSHAPHLRVGRMEFSDEKDDAGMPRWERPVQGEPTDAAVQAAAREYHERGNGEGSFDRAAEHVRASLVFRMRAALRAAAATQEGENR